MARPVRPTVWCALALLLAAPSAASAASFAVNSTLDAVDAATLDGVCATATGECTLRAAVQQANALPGADTITLPVGTFRLSIVGVEDAGAAGDLDVTGALAITGAGTAATVIDGGGDTGPRDGVIEAFAGGSLAVEGLTVRGGRLTDAGGAGIGTDADLTLTRVTVSGNVANSTGPTPTHGGGCEPSSVGQ